MWVVWCFVCNDWALHSIQYLRLSFEYSSQRILYSDRKCTELNNDQIQFELQLFWNQFFQNASYNYLSWNKWEIQTGFVSKKFKIRVLGFLVIQLDFGDFNMCKQTEYHRNNMTFFRFDERNCIHLRKNWLLSLKYGFLTVIILNWTFFFGSRENISESVSTELIEIWCSWQLWSDLLTRN